METQAEYIVNTEERSLEALLEEGRTKLANLQIEEERSNEEYRAEKLRGWNEALAPIKEKWPWMVEYIEDRRYELTGFDTGKIYMRAEIPGYAPLMFCVERNTVNDAWRIGAGVTFYVPAIVPGLRPSWRERGDAYLELSLALAVAEERGKIYEERLKAYSEAQEQADKQQIEELKSKEANERPEDCLIAILKELIQNEVCESCSRCS
ncbi:MAG: hypothetical protein JW908_00730 [Anaerolineales bacterium]|nr:hypothetical protein [Anaerolineales bacterium]